MQEKQVSVEGITYRLDPPFHVLATANPIEYEGTYPLPEAQLDRFLLRVSFGYPSRDEEWDVLRRRMARRQEESELAAGRRRRHAARHAGARWRTSPSRTRSAATSSTLTAATREHPQVLVGASPRGSLALLLLARAMAALAGRDYVIPEDVKAVAVPALAHRITLRPEMWLRRIDPSFVVAEVLAATPAPASGALPSYNAMKRRADAWPRSRHRPGTPRNERSARASRPAQSPGVCPPRAGRPASVPCCAEVDAAPAEAADEPQWVPTRALGRAVLLTGLLLIAGVLLGRVDLVVIAAPFAIGTAFAMRRRPGAMPKVRLGTDDTHHVEGAALTAGVQVVNRDTVGYDLVVVRTLVSPWLKVEKADRPHVITVARGGSKEIELDGEAQRWGRHPLGPASARITACDGLIAGRPVVSGARNVRVYPMTFWWRWWRWWVWWRGRGGVVVACGGVGELVVALVVVVAW